MSYSPATWVALSLAVALGLVLRHVLRRVLTCVESCVEACFEACAEACVEACVEARVEAGVKAYLDVSRDTHQPLVSASTTREAQHHKLTWHCVRQRQKLGLIIFQFQLSFGPSVFNRDKVADCRRRLHPLFHMAIEFRLLCAHTTANCQLPPANCFFL